MDFIVGLPVSEGNEVIMVIVDRLTKYAHFVGLKHPYTAASVAQSFMDNIFKLHGLPDSIVCNRDSIFTSNFWDEICKIQGIALKMSIAYHPQTDEQTEMVNRCFETYLRCMTGEQPKSWFKWLALAEWWFNTGFRFSTNLTPL